MDYLLLFLNSCTFDYKHGNHETVGIGMLKENTTCLVLMYWNLYIFLWNKTTVCPRSSYPNSFSNLLYKMGNYFLDIRYVSDSNLMHIYLHDCRIVKLKMNKDSTLTGNITEYT